MLAILIVAFSIMATALSGPAGAAQPVLVPPSSHARLGDTMDFLTDSASPGSAMILTGGMFVLGRSEEFRAAQIMAAAVAVSAGITGGLKWVFNRPRPSGVTVRSNSSFPSGHATGSFAMATVLAREYPRLAPILYLWAGSVSYSRLYKQRHYPSDVVAGAGIGILTARLALHYADRYVLSGKGMVGIIFSGHGAAAELRLRF